MAHGASVFLEMIAPAHREDRPCGIDAPARFDDNVQPAGEPVTDGAETPRSTPTAARCHAGPSWSLTFPLNPAWPYHALVIVLAAWILHGFVEALLAASVIAIASWPLYTRFVDRIGPRLPRGAISAIFTSLITVFVLTPMVLALVALVAEAQVLLNDIAAADQQGIGAPGWLGHVPLAGSWLADRWESQFGHPGALAGRTQQADPTLLLAWAEQLGRFTAHHALIIVFTVLALFFLYRDGETIAAGLRRVLRSDFVDAERYMSVATRAVQGSLNSIVIVGLCEGLAAGIAFALLGVPHAALWGAIIAALAVVPFLGYVAVAMLACRLALLGASGMALVSGGVGAAVLLLGDKFLRPAVARSKVSLPFVWFLMGCLGGFEVLGPVGLVVGPVVLSIARESWQRRVAHLPPT